MREGIIFVVSGPSGSGKTTLTRRVIKMVESNRFAEWAQVHDHRYGTPVEEIDRIRTSGVDLLLDIDSQGAKSIRKRCDSGVYIFIIPPTFDLLKDRIMRREGERTDEVARRIEDSINEMEEIHSYDYIIINDSLDEAVNKLKAVIIAERCKRERVLK